MEKKVNQVKLFGTVCVKKKLPLNEFQCACCIMLILKVEVVVGGEDYSKPKHTQHLNIQRWVVCVIGPKKKITNWKQFVEITKTMESISNALKYSIGIG